MDPCYQLASMFTDMRCQLDAAKRMLRKDDVEGARVQLVLLDQSARDVAEAFPPARRPALAIHEVADETINRWMMEKDLGEQEKRSVLSALQRLHPEVATMYEKGGQFCEIPRE